MDLKFLIADNRNPYYGKHPDTAHILIHKDLFTMRTYNCAYITMRRNVKRDKGQKTNQIWGITIMYDYSEI